MNGSWRFVRPRAAILAILLLASACSDDNASKRSSRDESCQLDISLTGDVDYESRPGDFACGFAVLVGNSFLAFFIAEGGGDIDVDLVGNAAPGEVGADLPAELGLTHSDGRSFDALGCRIELVENSFVRSTDNWEEYHLEGSGACSEPATSAKGERVAIGPFTFAANAGWEPD